MSLQELIQDLQNYPRDRVTLSVVDFNDPGDVLNVGETATFRVRIRNNGPLDMRNVTLHLNRANGTQLSQSAILGNPVNFSNELVTQPLDIPEGGSADTRILYVRATESSTTDVTLFTVHVREWDASLEPLLKNAAGHSPAGEISFARRIHAA